MKYKATIYKSLVLAAVSLFARSCGEGGVKGVQYPEYGGVYPHLAYYNNEGECGTGAVVPWQGKLWVVTYGPHLPWGSSDKLYEIDDTLGIKVRPESIGGTPADRMIHKESGQLIIGPYFIDSLCNVRALSYADAQGRYTGVARHLTDPADKVYIATMEEGFYEVDVHTLEHRELYPDANIEEHDDTGVNPQNDLLPGAHGKGLYSGQGVLVFSNNGEAVPEALEKFNIPSGSLSEWDGRDWKVVRRNQFTEVTGPGGIYGNPLPETDPIYALGWDYKSILLGVREDGGWNFYRLPKASHSYDGAHGWNTEWPRIREVGTPENPFMLMTMHGMFWEFPQPFGKGGISGIRPLSAYLKVIGDFTRWNGRLVFGCDDSAKKEFLNKRRIKGGIAGPGQSNSNLWFMEPGEIGSLGPTNATGAVWLNEDIRPEESGEPFLFGPWQKRCAWLKNDGRETVVFAFEAEDASGKRTVLKKEAVSAGSSCLVAFGAEDKGEWIRVSVDRPTKGSVVFSYASGERRASGMSPIFDGIAKIGDTDASKGLLYSLGGDSRRLGVSLVSPDQDSYYEMGGDMLLQKKEKGEEDAYIRKNLSIASEGVEITSGSVLISDDKGRRWHLPLGPSAFTAPTAGHQLRICREVATERDLLNLHGTFYELPAENADGFAKVRPVSSHDLNIYDYASFRGMLLMTGCASAGANDNKRIVRSDDGKLAVWAGAIDDLWKLGKPTGSGGPWVDSSVAAGEYSDPYLIGFYDDRELNISHKSDSKVTFTVEADPTGEGDWMHYADFEVNPEQSFIHHFPDAFQARWIRFRADKACVATTWLEYR